MTKNNKVSTKNVEVSISQLLGQDIFSIFFEKLHNYIKDDNRARDLGLALEKIKESGYFSRMIIDLSEIRGACEEIEDLLKKCDGEKHLFLTVFKIDNLIQIHKLYYTMWGTVVDLLAKYINIIYDIGLHDRDVNLEMILRNSHFKLTPVAVIIERYKKKCDMDKCRKIRNDIVHRNKINDEQIITVRSKRQRLISKRYSFLGEEKISEDVYKHEMKIIDKEVQGLFGVKKVEYYNHYQALVKMLGDVLQCLAIKFVDQAIMKAAVSKSTSSK